MLTTEAFTDKFNDLLSEIPEGTTLAQWQQAYRGVMFTMAMKITGQFPSAAICSNQNPITAKSTGGGGEGGNPSFARPIYGDCHFLYLPAFVLAMQTPPVAAKRKPKK